MPKIAIFACAGPVADNQVVFTANCQWLIAGTEICKSFPGIETCKIINDFEAQGYGVLTIDHEKEVVALNTPKTLVNGKPRKGYPMACVGAGTGLGECYLTPDGDTDYLVTNPDAAVQYSCYPSEGGHAEFAPRNDLEREMLVFLQKKFSSKHRVSIERVVSGTGLANIYEFMALKYPTMLNAEVHAEFLKAGPMQGKVVSVNAKECKVCDLSMRTFASSYGSEVGVAALKFIPLSGLYVTGGLTPKNLEWILNPSSDQDKTAGKGAGEFMQAFKDKGRVSALLDDVPVWAVLVEDLGVRGAWVLGGKIWNQKYADKPETSAGSESSDIIQTVAKVALGVSLGVALSFGLGCVRSRK
jgi:glucokinase